VAKPIPKKKAKAKAEIPVAKAKKEKLPPKVKARLKEIQDKADTRYAWAHDLYKQQPADVQGAVNFMLKTMANGAGPPRFTMDGHSYPVDMEILRDIQRKSHLWISMRMLVACAEWGIRIGNFKAPKKHCIRCGKSVVVKAKKKGKKK
jgi:hypothetical protein